ncbi:MAG: RluA family pseudouridine synthase, partial [Turicibacter sp.]|nr:RluA family pseudouridine synthase [Turicibacter sp.]
MNVTRKDEQLIFIIESEQANQTVREFLQKFHLSRKKIHELYMDKKITINEKISNFNEVLQVGDQVAIPVFEKEEIDFTPQKMKLDIIYEDDHLLIINKPAGIMVHPDQKSGLNTLVNGVAFYYQQ